MKQITKFLSNDNVEFLNQSECLAHEKLCATVDEIMSALPTLPKDDGCKFANGHGFIQHDEATFLKVRAELLQQAAKLSSHHWIRQSIDDVSVHPSYAGRIIGEIGGPLWRGWNRIYCTDKSFREWGQPYYAEHPYDAKKQFCINA